MVIIISRSIGHRTKPFGFFTVDVGGDRLPLTDSPPLFCSFVRLLLLVDRVLRLDYCCCWVIDHSCVASSAIRQSGGAAGGAVQSTQSSFTHIHRANSDNNLRQDADYYSDSEQQSLRGCEYLLSEFQEYKEDESSPVIIHCR